MQKIGTFISNNRKFIPLFVTALLFFVAYAVGAGFFQGMRDPQIFLNLFRTAPFLLIAAIGGTFVILTGGIDLSVGGVIALTTVASAALLRAGWDPWVVMLLMLAMGIALGATIGSFITYLKVQPFIATLAALWITRGLCFFISDDSISIDHPTYKMLSQTKILIPGLSDPVTKEGDYISLLVVLALVVLAMAIYIAHYTPFGRAVYAIGGNEQSARLMGLPVNRTKVLVYTLSGFCSALAGITLSIYVGSGHGLYAGGFELTVIASVVMGGTMLTGGAGYILGTLFGVLILGVTQTLIQFNGQLSSWWTNIVVGALTLIFIGVQSLLAASKARSSTSEEMTGGGMLLMLRRNRKPLLIGGGALLVIVLAAFAINAFQVASPTVAACELKPFRQEQAASLIKAGAVIAYERHGGPSCIDELYAIYPDGQIKGDEGEKEVEKQVTPTEVDALLAGINNLGWFTEEIYSTSHTPCRQCYTYFISVSYQGQEKTVQAVDGGTDAPSDYWQVVSLINGTIPRFNAP